MKKYRIRELLDDLPNKDFKFAMQVLPSVIGTSRTTLMNYISLDENSSSDIPYQKVVALERFFGIREGDLANIKPWIKNFRELQRDTNKRKK